MSELFTTFESVTPPRVLSPEIKQNYREIQLMETPEDTLENSQEDSSEDWSFLDNTDTYLKKPSFIQSTSNNTSSLAQKVINQARQFVGGKYSWGGSNPSTGFDCSGLMQYIFKSAGINLPRTAAQQGKIGQEVNLQQAKPGDVIWFGSNSSPSGQHIGLISRIDNGQVYIIDAAGKKLGIVERPLPNLQIKSIRRLLGNTFNSSSNGSLQQYIVSFFRNKGLTDSQARGILGNLMQESRGNHTITNKTSGAFGLAQWLGPRKQRLIQKYGNNPTVEQQLEFIWEELNTTESKAFQHLLNTNTIADATRAFAQHFERSRKNEMNMNKRINFAYRA